MLPMIKRIYNDLARHRVTRQYRSKAQRPAYPWANLIDKDAGHGRAGV